MTVKSGTERFFLIRNSARVESLRSLVLLGEHWLSKDCPQFTWRDFSEVTEIHFVMFFDHFQTLFRDKMIVHLLKYLGFIII